MLQRYAHAYCKFLTIFCKYLQFLRLQRIVVKMQLLRCHHCQVTNGHSSLPNFFGSSTQDDMFTSKTHPLLLLLGPRRAERTFVVAFSKLKGRRCHFTRFLLYRLPYFAYFCSSTCSAFISSGCSWILAKIYCCSGCKWYSVLCECSQIMVGVMFSFFKISKTFSLGVIKFTPIGSVRPAWLEKLNSNDFQAWSKSM